MTEETTGETRQTHGNGAEVEAAKRGYIFKASVIGQDLITAPGSVNDPEQDKIRSLLGSAGVLEPAYDPRVLLRIWENSGSLNPNIESYVTNIDGLGWRLEAVVNFDSDTAFETVREQMWIERLKRSEEMSVEAETDGVMTTLPSAEDPLSMMPTDTEVEAKIEGLGRQQRIENVRLTQFLNFVNPEGSFTSLRRMTRQNLEITGNAYWEVLRNRRGEIARFVHVPPSSVRCTSLDNESTLVDDRVPAGFGWEVVKQRRFFRRYIQATGRKTVWFKQFGDPRVVSQDTGRVYTNRADFEALKGNGDHLATELIHFKVERAGEAYGQPRWIGNLLAVLGSRATDEVNFAYFDNKAIPPLALMVSGGSLGDDAVTRIQKYFEDEIKGRSNYHKLLVIEASGGGGLSDNSTIPKIEFKSLVEAQQGDAQFQKYDERNVDKVGSSFRLPRLLRGDVRDFNRATADASLRFADEQVFQPERNEFDAWLNRVVLPKLGITLWRFVSLGPRTRDPELISQIVKDALAVLAPNEARAILADALGRELPPFSEGWAKQPLQLTLAGFQTSDQVDAENEATDDLMGAAMAHMADQKPADSLRVLTATARAMAMRRETMQTLSDMADTAHQEGEKLQQADAADGAPADATSAAASAAD